MLVAQAPGAQIESFRLPVNNNGNWVNVRHPATISVAFGVAYIMAELR